jgi:hypothetical protein
MVIETMWKNLWKMCKKYGTRRHLRVSRRSHDMHTGITIEQLIATVARVDEKVEKAQWVYRELPQIPVMPFRETANLFARHGVM